MRILAFGKAINGEMHVASACHGFSVPIRWDVFDISSGSKPAEYERYRFYTEVLRLSVYVGDQDELAPTRASGYITKLMNIYRCLPNDIRERSGSLWIAHGLQCAFETFEIKVAAREELRKIQRQMVNSMKAGALPRCFIKPPP